MSFRALQFTQDSRATRPARNARLSVTLIEDYVREIMRDAFNVEIQVYGSNYDNWLEYIQSLGDDFVLNGNILTLSTADTIKLIITQSLCKASII